MVSSSVKSMFSAAGERILEVAFNKDVPGLEASLRANGSVVGVSRQGDKYHIHTTNASVVVKEVAALASLNDLEIVSINTTESRRCLRQVYRALRSSA